MDVYRTKIGPAVSGRPCWKVVEGIQRRRDNGELVVIEVGVGMSCHGDRRMARGLLQQP